MSKVKKILRLIVVSICIVGLLITSIGVFGASKSKYSFKLTIMAQYFGTEPAPSNSPVILKAEQYLKTDLEFTWVPADGYNDKLNIMLASGNLPMVVYVPGKTASIIGACKAGAFWELGPYIKQYKNLKTIPDIVLWNSSIDGKIYGIPRSRTLGRNGIVYRKDWAKNVGITKLETIDDLYNMLKKFTYNDPDKDGKNDTYGMIVCNYNGPFYITLTWFGGPNGWGLNKNGQLVPSFLTNAYLENLKFWRKMYQEKLFNHDFPSVPGARWEDYYSQNKGGVKIDVIDSANRIYNGLKNNGFIPKDAKDTDIMDIVVSVKGRYGLRNMPTSGYAGYLMVSKTSVKNMNTFKKVMSILDKFGDRTMQDLFSYGLPNRHYKLVDGKIDPIQNLPADLSREVSSLNQVLHFYPANGGTPRYMTPLLQLQADMQALNEKLNILVPNPAEALIGMSETYIKRGVTLDNMIEDTRVKYITGQINDQGFKKVLDNWRKQGGDQIIKEVNALYRKYRKNIPYKEDLYMILNP